MTTVMNIATALHTLNAALAVAAKLGPIVQTLHTEGRTMLNDAELASLRSDDDAENLLLDAAIAQAEAAGR